MATQSNLIVSLWYANLLLVGCFSTFVTGITMKGEETDREALLAIKSQIRHDPLGVTNSWNNSVALCRWEGIICGRRHQRVTMLDLSHKRLTSTLSPYVGNLSFLRYIDLGDNSFHGFIPPEIGRLSRLQTLVLANNSFGGTIPANLSHCSSLTWFNANRNNLVQNIPIELGDLLKLETLAVAYNNLTGELPTSLGNISTLQHIYLRENHLRGRVPETLGHLKRLITLQLTLNNFSGLIPPPIFNISSLTYIYLAVNQFDGSLPANLGSNLPNLLIFYVGGNNLSGILPESMSNASKLQRIELSENSFNGKVSLNFQNLQNFSYLNMESNNLGRGGSGDLEFITTLTNCSMLEGLGLNNNKFGGLLPNSITNLTLALTFLYLGRNQIAGTIPFGMTKFVNLNGLGLEDNKLTGTIPPSIGKLQNLQLLTLGRNAFTGRIPTSLGNLSLLTILGLEYNLLEGSIPPELGKCQSLTQMVLEGNSLTGTLPRDIFSIVTFFMLSLSNNFLAGSLPSEIGNLKTLIFLNLDGNKFSGQIPTTLSSCTSLEKLYLGGNHFSGSIPTSLSSLKSIVELDLSNNNLSGQIPKYLEKLSLLKYLNLSYNHFEGQVPTGGVFSNTTEVAIAGNDRLCGGIPELHLPLCHLDEPKKHVPHKVIFIVCGVVGFFLLCSLLFCYLWKRGVVAKPSSSFRLKISILMVSYQQLREATDGFSSNNLVGKGSFGRVYRGILNLNQDQESSVVAVKVINLQGKGASKSFLAECRALRNAKHRNLVKIISACSSVDFQGNPFKALIYEFLPNESLEQWLHPPTQANTEVKNGGQRVLKFLQRINIAIDVASALDYLHHYCEVPIVHCDLKPSNILLDDDMVAHVGDFGLARFFPKSMNKFSGNSTSTLGLKGTIGYAAPEYGMGTEATKSGDMYSYGILLLEMFTGKRPTDEMFKDGLTLHHFVKAALPDQLLQLEVVDPLLVAEDYEEENASSSKQPRRAHLEKTRMKECLISIMSVGIACSVESPKDRMATVDAAKELHSIRGKFFGAGIQTPKQLAGL